jgi:hypothetical protein
MKKEDICSRYISAKMEVKSLNEEIKDLEKTLKKDLQDEFRKKGSAIAHYGDYTVTLTEQSRVLADAQALKEAGIFEKYSKPSLAEYLKVTRK